MASSGKSARERGEKAKIGSDGPAEGTQQEQSEKLVRQKALSENLRSIFHGIADEPVPSSMLNLLDELERKGGRK